MTWWMVVGGAVGLLLLGVIAQRLGWVDVSNRHRTSGSAGAFAALDEVFFPTKHEAQVERDRQTLLPAPAPLAGDDDKGVYTGKVRIELDSGPTA